MLDYVESSSDIEADVREVMILAGDYQGVGDDAVRRQRRRRSNAPALSPWRGER
jgi:hypothetical protein